MQLIKTVPLSLTKKTEWLHQFKIKYQALKLLSLLSETCSTHQILSMSDIYLVQATELFQLPAGAINKVDESQIVGSSCAWLQSKMVIWFIVDKLLIAT